MSVCVLVASGCVPVVPFAGGCWVLCPVRKIVISLCPEKSPRGNNCDLQNFYPTDNILKKNSYRFKLTPKQQKNCHQFRADGSFPNDSTAGESSTRCTHEKRKLLNVEFCLRAWGHNSLGGLNIKNFAWFSIGVVHLIFFREDSPIMCNEAPLSPMYTVSLESVTRLVVVFVAFVST